MLESTLSTRNSLDHFLLKESNTSLGLRRVTEGDIQSLIPLVNSAYAYENEGEKAFKKADALRANTENIQQAIDEGIVVVATTPGSKQIIGCFQYKEIPASEDSLSDQETNAYFGMLTVDPSRQRQGIGKKLVQVAEAMGRMRGKNTMEIQVVNHSTHLLDIYTKMGYKEFGRKDWSIPVLTKPSQFVLLSKKL